MPFVTVVSCKIKNTTMCYSSEHSLIMETHYKVRELENQKQLSGSPPVIATTVSLHLSQSFTLHS